jgi:hypothetical protein
MLKLPPRWLLGKPVESSESFSRPTPDDPDAAIIQVGAPAALGREHLVPHGVVNHARDRLAPALQPHCHVEHRVAVRKIGGPVERVHVPAILGAGIHPAAFLGDDRVGRKVRPQTLHHQRLGCPVRFRNQVVLAFPLHGDPPLEVAGQQGAGLPRDAGGGFQVVGHDLRCGGEDSGFAQLVEILDVVLVNEEIRAVLAR